MTSPTDTTGPAAPTAPVGGSFAPRPGAAPMGTMIRAQAALETKMLLRNGEQLLLTVVIPALLLLVFSTADIVDTGAGRSVDFLAPGVLALAVLSTAFTGQAIATGFDRRYGVLRLLGTSPLGRLGLLAGKAAAVLAVVVLQYVVIGVAVLLVAWFVVSRVVRRQRSHPDVPIPDEDQRD